MSVAEIFEMTHFDGAGRLNTASVMLLAPSALNFSMEYALFFS